MRVRWGRLLRGGHDITQLVQCGAIEPLAHFREEIVLLFLDVMAHVLDQHGDLGVKTLSLRWHRFEIGEHPLDDVMLLEALEGHVLGAGHDRPRHWIEALLLDGGVHRKLLDEAIHDLSLLDVSSISRLLETFEQLLDRLVVSF